MTGFEQDCLKAHNEYRAKHGVPPLKWNKQLRDDAQKWANTLAQRGDIVYVYIFLFVFAALRKKARLGKIWHN